MTGILKYFSPVKKAKAQTTNNNDKYVVGFEFSMGSNAKPCYSIESTIDVFAINEKIFKCVKNQNNDDAFPTEVYLTLNQLKFVTDSPKKSVKKRTLDKIETDLKSPEMQSPMMKKRKLESNLNVNKIISFGNCDELFPNDWREFLGKEFTKEYFSNLCKTLEKEEKANGVQIYPVIEHVFRAFSLCSWSALKVVILGQDPYHGPKQAEGLCFSVQKGVRLPSSLRNIFKEAATDVGFVHPGHGSLTEWATQGILLLNTVLTVRAGSANSHKKYGWQKFTDAVIQCISKKKREKGCVFILWGKQSQKKLKMIDVNKHRIIQSVHPSGLSAHRGFFGSKPFSKTNKFLKEMGYETSIDWQTTK